MVTREPNRERPAAAGGSQAVYTGASDPLPYRTLKMGKVLWKFPDEGKDSWGLKWEPGYSGVEAL